MFSIRIAMAVMLAACLVTGAQAAEKAKPAAALKGPAQAEATYDDPWVEARLRVPSWAY